MGGPVNIVEIPIEKWLEALPHLSRNNGELPPIIYNLVVWDDKKQPIPEMNCSVAFDAPGALTTAMSHADSADVTFTLQKGGFATMIGMLLDGTSGGMRSATMSFSMGRVAIAPSGAEGMEMAQLFFKRVDVGQDKVLAALDKAGHSEVTGLDFTLPM